MNHERDCRRQFIRHRDAGPERSDIAADARMLVIERWIALYRVVEQGVQIVDGARDVSRLIAPQE